MSVVPLGGLLGVSATGASETIGPRLVRLTDLANLMAEAEEQALLPVLVAPLRPADRGKLALVLEEAIEAALERRGACPPGVGAAADLDSSLGDQLYRARLVEARGLCLFVASLEGAATLAGALDAEDSAVLRFWFEAARTRPVRLLLDESNRALAAYGPPIPLAELVDGAARAGIASAREATPLVAPEVAASAETMELSESPPAVASKETRPEPPASTTGEPEPDASSALPNDDRQAAPPIHEPLLAGEMARALVEKLGLESPARPLTLLDTEPTPPSAQTPVAPPVFADELPTMHDAGASVHLVQASAQDEISAVHAVGSHRETLPDTETPAPSDVAAPPVPSLDAEVEPAAMPEAPAAAAVPAGDTAVATELQGPLHPAAASDWQSWVRDLEGARGPRPLAVVERMFAMSYVPLRDAYLRGIAPSEVLTTLEGWAASFAKSYREAFDALRVRGKRPTMVLDVPEAALRIGRLHGARSVQLLLVDGLRFDLGLRVELGLRARLGREVALTERLLLWSALPSNTATQLELIGRGSEGLREFSGVPESEVPVARGRMAKTPRRIKAGHRELWKLDLVEARLSEAGGAESPRLDALGVEVTDAIAELCEKLPPRTLLFVFGDHGFHLEPHGDGTGPLEHGGSRPEEVLVPAFAWLVGGVQ
jgi:hypothetical protein